MAIKLSEEEIKNLKELINSDDVECIMLAHEIISTLDEELKLKYEKTVYLRMIGMLFKKQYKFKPLWFLE